MRDGLNASELDVFRAILRWATDQRRFPNAVLKDGCPVTPEVRLLLALQYLGLRTLLEDCVKFAFISIDDLWHCVRPAGVFSGDQLLTVRSQRALRAAKG
jgi:hypothetical protein